MGVLPGLQCDRNLRDLLEEYADVLRLHGHGRYSWGLDVGRCLRELLDLREQGPPLRGLPLRLPAGGRVSAKFRGAEAVQPAPASPVRRVACRAARCFCWLAHFLCCDALRKKKGWRCPALVRLSSFFLGGTEAL